MSSLTVFRYYSKIVENKEISKSMTQIYSQLPGVLLPWYREHRRPLPWRQTRDPYKIWLSEIMLQQTRVEAVRGYYARFLEVLPDIASLADCEDDTLYKLWEGLGYYSRVRNLKKAARVITETHNGIFPGTYEDVLALPGIGEYTAGAVCSIAFGLPAPAVDGNVLRVCARLTDDASPIDLPATKKKVRAALAEVYPPEAGDFTQALMELGATLCGPNRAPDCEHCPCRDFCLGYSRGTAQSLPVKAPKKAKRQEDRTVFIIRCEGSYALEKRPANGLLAGLWQYPNVSGHLSTEEAVKHLAQQSLRVTDVLRESEKKHIFTHIQWNMKGIYLEVAEPAGDFQWFTAQQIQNEAALPTAFRQFREDTDDV